MNLRDRIEQELKNHPHGLTIKELAKIMDWDSSDLKVSLEKMSYKNRVDSQNGKWFLT